MQLRAKQKRDRHVRIVDAAGEMFGIYGFDETSLERIAERAEVSVGTIYNYYENKAGLLLALLLDEGRMAFDLGERIVANHDGTARALIQRLIAHYVAHPFAFMGREGWRHALAAYVLNPQSKFGKSYNEVDRRLGQQMADVVAKVSTSGGRPIIDPNVVGDVLFNNVNQMFTNYLAADDVTLDDMQRELAKQTDTILDLLGFESDDPVRAQ